MNFELILLAFGVIFLISLVYSYMRDTENSRQIRFLANTMDNFNKQMFELERKVENINLALKKYKPQSSLEDIDKKLEMELASMAEPIAHSLNEVQSAFSHFKVQIESRLEHVEDGMKSMIMPKSLTGLDDQKIISLYKQGMDEETIARELALSKGEVEFALKISKMQ
ncbi:MAG: hypothetical protein COA44_10565 [Arcobacter sp.]|nr:MAG: hypothetical protein COA44_10565 [Arcobacter sp.]